MIPKKALRQVCHTGVALRRVGRQVGALSLARAGRRPNCLRQRHAAALHRRLRVDVRGYNELGGLRRSRLAIMVEGVEASKRGIVSLTVLMSLLLEKCSKLFKWIV